MSTYEIEFKLGKWNVVQERSHGVVRQCPSEERAEHYAHKLAVTDELRTELGEVGVPIGIGAGAY